MNGDLSPLLIANRGEIAVRIMRTARAMGLRTVAVYSDADRDAMHVRAADDAIRIGPAPAGESYLSIDAILAAAKTSGARAIHPGYGFLSENAAFARAVLEAGLVFVGPPASAIEAMGDKARAKRRMIEAGVPCVPGYEGADQAEKTLLAAAKAIGFPLMVKASAGGGGRGMRLVEKQSELAAALKLARSEAERAFSNGDLILEKAIQRPRHVEVQVFADTHGSTLHLGERDCSVQRRHQKVIEEAPCPVMTAPLRERMGAAAVEAARAVGYVGAGTVEFLLDAEGQFYFLEMNTRLQVEHPVTELVTGLDLVELQLRVARGERLPVAQNDIVLDGHAIEVRLYAEEPEAGFLPSTGRVELFKTPVGAGVRIDAGIETGDDVSPFYDPMIAKIVAHGPTREDARTRLVAALGCTAVFGLRTNRDFLIDALGQGAFSAGAATTAFIGESYGERYSPAGPDEAVNAAAAVIQHAAGLARSHALARDVSCELLNWSSAGRLTTIVEYQGLEKIRKYAVRPTGARSYTVSTDDASHDVTVLALGETSARLRVDGAALHVTYQVDDRSAWLATDTCTVERLNLASFAKAATSAAGQGALLAPMHGKLLDICVSEGDSVKRGDRLAVLEAMKMQHELTAGVDGRVTRIAATTGEQIAARSLILEIEPLPGGAS